MVKPFVLIGRLELSQLDAKLANEVTERFKLSVSLNKKFSSNSSPIEAISAWFVLSIIVIVIDHKLFKEFIILFDFWMKFWESLWKGPIICFWYDERPIDTKGATAWKKQATRERFLRNEAVYNIGNWTRNWLFRY